MSRAGRAPTRQGARSSGAPARQPQGGSRKARPGSTGAGGDGAARRGAKGASTAEPEVVEPVDEAAPEVDEAAVVEARQPVPPSEVAPDDDAPEVTDRADGQLPPPPSSASTGAAADPTEMLRPAEPTGWRGPLESIAARPRLFALPIVVFVTIALVATLMRAPVYSGESQVIVGSVVRDYQFTDGQVQAIQQLTDVYSRLVGSSAHLDKVNAALGTEVPPGAITGAPIPDSALIRVDAQGATQQEAVDRADAGATQLIAYVDELRAQAATEGQGLLDQVNAASRDATAAQLARDQAQAVVNAAAPGSATRANADQTLQAAEATLATAQLKLDTLQQNYRTVQDANAGGIGVSSFQPAEPLGNDRRSKAQIYVIGALLAGALLGMALATLAANGWRLLPSAGEPETAG